MRPIPSSTRWCRTRRTIRCSRSERKKLHAQHRRRAGEASFRSRVAKEPELLAHHLTEAGQLGIERHPALAQRPASRRWREWRCRKPSPTSRRGSRIVDRLPPSAERDSLELSLREPLHSARLRWRGWATPEVGVERHRRSSGCAEPAAVAEPAGRALGHVGQHDHAGPHRGVAAWARRLLVEGSQTAAISICRSSVTARCVSSHFYLGELQEALEQRERVLALYDPRHAPRWMELTGNECEDGGRHLRVADVVDAGLSRPGRAAAATQKDADARQLGHPFDIGWALTWGAYVFDYRREPDRSAGAASPRPIASGASRAFR